MSSSAVKLREYLTEILSKMPNTLGEATNHAPVHFLTEDDIALGNNLIRLHTLERRVYQELVNKPGIVVIDFRHIDDSCSLSTIVNAVSAIQSKLTDLADSDGVHGKRVIYGFNVETTEMGSPM